MPGSQTTPNRADARVVASARIAFHVKDRVCVRNKNHFRGSMAGLCVPLSTLRRRPHGRLRMTRGHCGSLLLQCSGLSPPTPRRFRRRTHDVILSLDGFEFAVTDPAQREGDFVLRYCLLHQLVCEQDGRLHVVERKTGREYDQVRGLRDAQCASRGVRWAVEDE